MTAVADITRIYLKVAAERDRLQKEKETLLTALRNVAQWSEYAKAVIAFVEEGE